mmetsp:Transcript_11968/g.26457  ORF Transcript_11968/g.26457 Transcript_11968/m.26457 type:complete len:373 (+) Transcript_11968:55-1173(+)
MVEKKKPKQPKDGSKKQQPDIDALLEAPPVDPKKTAGGVVILVALLGGAAFVALQLYTALLGGFVELDVQDTGKLKEVFFSGDPWLVFCQKDASTEIPVSLTAASKSLFSEVNFGVVDCWKPLKSSNKTLMQRWSLSESRPPAFLVANGNPPLQMVSKHYSDPDAATEWIRSNSQPAVVGKMNPERFEKECTSRESCVVLGSKSDDLDKDFKKLLLETMQSTRVRVVNVDTSVWSVKLSDKVAETKPRGLKKTKAVPTLLCIGKRVPLKKAKKAKLTDKDKVAVGGFIKGEADDPVDLAAFLQECKDPGYDYGLVEIDEMPTLSRKEKKSSPKPSPPPSKSTPPVNTKVLSELDQGWDALIKELSFIGRDED